MTDSFADLISRFKDEDNPPEAKQRYTGTLLSWHPSGYGFIKPDDGGENQYAHVTQFPERTTKFRLPAGTRVSYEVGLSPRYENRTEARNVRII